MDQARARTDRWLFEREAWDAGHTLVAGVDEVGRAAWAGPMLAAAVILPRDFDATGVRSSKRMKPSSREKTYARILREAVAVSVHEVTPADIDTRGIDACNIELLREAVHRLDVEPDFVLVDYHSIPDLRYPQRAITDGDDLSVSIAAASIVAKVECDRMMQAFAEQYPDYGFAETKGYGSTEHEAAISRLGPSSIHRRSVRPVRAWLAQHGGSSPEG